MQYQDSSQNSILRVSGEAPQQVLQTERYHDVPMLEQRKAGENDVRIIVDIDSDELTLGNKKKCFEIWGNISFDVRQWTDWFRHVVCMNVY